MFFKRVQRLLTKKDIQRLSCLFCFDNQSLLVTVFTHLPPALQYHGIRVGAIAGLMAKAAPDDAIPQGMSREQYADAVRYGAQYHDIAAYLVYNERERYPESGERFLREQIGEHTMDPLARKVILETVLYCSERYDGKGYPEGLRGDQIPLHAQLCAIANAADERIAEHGGSWKRATDDAQAFIHAQEGAMFSARAVRCCAGASAGATYVYKVWSKKPPAPV